MGGRPERIGGEDFNPEWLQRECTVAELEAETMVDGIPFGRCHRDWEALKAKVLPGDGVWLWSSDGHEGGSMIAWEGIALVRAGVIVDSFITKLIWYC